MEVYGRSYSYLFPREILKSYILTLVFFSYLSGKFLPIEVLNPQKADKLLAIGNVVFSQGEIFSPNNLKVVNHKNVEIPSKVANIVRWPDESIMLTTVMFVAQTNKGDIYYINYGCEILRTNELKVDDTKDLIETNFIISKDLEDRSFSVMVDVVKTANLEYYFYVFCIVFILTVLIYRKILLRK